MLHNQFAAAKNQDHSYCRWGQVLPKDAVTQSMFIASGCPNPIDPHHASAGDRLTFCTTCTDYFNFTIAPTASPSLIDPIAPINGSFLPILDQVELFRAIDAYVENGTSSGVLELYGYPIGNWDVSQVTDFSYAFASDRNVKVCAFNEDIGMWNTSEAVSMSFMFAGAALFTQDISSWITNKVTNMTGMCKFSSFAELLLRHYLLTCELYFSSCSHGCRFVRWRFIIMGYQCC